jgi:hypothetical protein
MITSGKSEDPVKKYGLPRSRLFLFAFAFQAQFRKVAIRVALWLRWVKLPMSKDAATHQRDGILHDAIPASRRYFRFTDTAGGAPGTATSRDINLRCRHDGQSSAAFSD